MVHPCRMAAMAALALALAACQSYPLGMSKEEWARLTPEQQMQARLKQAELDKANAQRRAQQYAARRQRLALQEARERRRIETLYRSGEFGDVLECVLDRGLADFDPGWRPYEPVAFALVRGERKHVSLGGNGRRTGRFWATLSPNGLEVSICNRQPAGRASSKACATVIAGSTDYARGVRRPITVEDGFKNSRLQCAYRPVAGQQTVVVDHRYVEIHRHIQRHHRPGVTRLRHVVVREHRRPAGRVAAGRGREARRASPTHGPAEIRRNPARRANAAPKIARELEDAVTTPPTSVREIERVRQGERHGHAAAREGRAASPGAESGRAEDKAEHRPPGPPPHARAAGRRDGSTKQGPDPKDR